MRGKNFMPYIRGCFTYLGACMFIAKLTKWAKSDPISSKGSPVPQDAHTLLGTYLSACK